MQTFDSKYIELGQKILNDGVYSENRTATNTVKIFGEQLKFDLREGFPVPTTKQLFTRGTLKELHWFLDGSTNIQPLLDDDVHIWDGWANSNGDIGPAYGMQWRDREDTQLLLNSDPYYKEKLDYYHNSNHGYSLVTDYAGGKVFTRRIDQIAIALNRLSSYPDCRRIIVDAWNPAVLPLDSKTPSQQAEIGKQALPACHAFFQFSSVDRGDSLDNGLHYTRKIHNIYTIDGVTYINARSTRYTEEQLQEMTDDRLMWAINDSENSAVTGAEYDRRYKCRELNLHLYIRSQDYFLGGPFNYASYAALIAYFCAILRMRPSELTVSFGDLHLYENQIEAFNQQAANLPDSKALPVFITFGVGPQQKSDLKGLDKSNYRIVGYEHCGKIKADVAI